MVNNYVCLFVVLPGGGGGGGGRSKRLRLDGAVGSGSLYSMIVIVLYIHVLTNDCVTCPCLCTNDCVI